jgi:glutathione S-transferase
MVCLYLPEIAAPIYPSRMRTDMKLGRIPVIVDNTKTPAFPVMETSAELLYLLEEYDKDDVFGFKDELERSQCLQWLFFWHGSVSSSCRESNYDP